MIALTTANVSGRTRVIVSMVIKASAATQPWTAVVLEIAAVMVFACWIMNLSMFVGKVKFYVLIPLFELVWIKEKYLHYASPRFCVSSQYERKYCLEGDRLITSTVDVFDRKGLKVTTVMVFVHVIYNQTPFATPCWHRKSEARVDDSYGILWSTS